MTASALSRRGVRHSAASERRRTPRWMFLGGIAIGGLLVAAATTGGTYALWNDGALFPGTTLRAGNLDLVQNGAETWAQMTPGVADEASGTLLTTPTQFLTQPGDVIEFTEPVRAILTGDNIGGALTVSYGSGQQPAGDITTTFHVDDANGDQVAPASGEAGIGDTVTLPGLLVGSTDWTVVVTVSVGGSFAWEQNDPLAAASTSSWTTGTFVTALAQDRTAGSGP